MKIPFEKVHENDDLTEISKRSKLESEIFGNNIKDKEKSAKHTLFICSLWALWIIVIAMLTIRAVHYLLPYCYHWLDHEQLTALDKLLFSGALGTLLGRYGNKIIE